MSDQQYLEDPDARKDVTADVPDSVESRRADDPTYAPQGPGDPGYEAPLIVPELDLEGGTVFKVGDQEFETLAEAQESLAPDDVVPSQDPALERGDDES